MRRGASQNVEEAQYAATPLDWWLYGLLIVFTIAWLPLEWYAEACSKRVVLAARIATALVWLMAVAVELPCQFTPRLPALGNVKLFLIGDSVSAGMSDADKGTWPKLMAEKYAIEVRDLSNGDRAKVANAAVVAFECSRGAD